MFELGKALSKTIWNITYGTDMGQVYYDSHLNFGEGAGPEAFWVENEASIYVLDTLNKRINHYVDGVCSGEFALTSAFSPKCFFIRADGTVYVCDMHRGEARLLIYHTDGSLDAFELEASTMRGIEVFPDGKITILDWHEKKFYDISDGTLRFVRSQALECSEMSGDDYARYLANDGAFRYEMQVNLAKCSMLMGEIRIVAIDADGDIAGGARVPLEELAYFPTQYIQIDKDGLVYFMIPMENCLEIRKVRLGTVNDSKMEELIASAQKYEEKKASLSTEYSVFAAPSFTRNQVSSRANQIIAQKWTLSADNTKTGTDVELPKYIQEIVDKGLLKNGGTVELSGIPYCWGGFDSLYTSNTWGCSDFSGAIAEGCTAGNVNTSGNKKSKTAGLDCSGFVSAAYGFSSKWSTDDFWEYGNEVKTVEELQSMDFFVKKGHVVLFYLWPTAGRSTMIIMESTTTDDYDKTVIREVKREVYLKGYEMRSPW